MLALLAPSVGIAACAPTGTDQTCTNSVAISGGASGIRDTDILTLTNTATGSVIGTSTGTAYGVAAPTAANVDNWGIISATGRDYGYGIVTATANVNNWGAISGTGGLGYGIFGVTTANVKNWGSISGTGSGPSPNGTGINAGTANVSNWGTISGTGHDNGTGINAGTANVSNWGTISGTSGSNGIGIKAAIANVSNWGIISGTSATYGYGIFTTGTANVTNGGTISGSTDALYFGGKAILSLLPGSILIGGIHLTGSGNTVNFRTGNQNLTFDTLTGATITSAVPFVVSGSQVATVDPTPFALSVRTLMDFSGGVSSAMEDRFNEDFGNASGGGGAALGYADETDAGARFASVFAGGAGQSSDTPKVGNLSVRYADGMTVWARGFAGKRVQDADGGLIGASNRFFGGMIGADRQVRQDLRLGAFLGAGQTRLSEDHNLGSNDNDLVFGGLYGHAARGASFLDALLQGGAIHASSTRTVNNNLAPNGIETANASYDGWYISPQATYGKHYALGTLGGASYTLTPSVNLRYLYASLGGYIESGTTTAPLTVGARRASGFEESAGIKLTRTVRLAPDSLLTSDLFGGVFGDQRAGGAAVNATLLGQAIPFAVPGKSDSWGGFAGAGVDGRTGNVDLSATASVAFSGAGYVFSGTGGVRASF